MALEDIRNALSGVGQTAMDVGRNVGQTAMGLAGLTQQPTNQRPSLYGDISQGDRFRALGAAVGGRLPQFEQQLMQENQMKQAQGMQSLQMREALAKTIAQDAQAGLLMAQSGDTQGFIDLIQDRIQLERQMGMDSTESENTLRDFQTGGFGAVFDDLQRAVTMGYTSGYLEGDEFVGTEKGVAMFKTPSGEIRTERLSGVPQRTPDEAFKVATDIRKEFSGLDLVKDFQNRQGAKGVIETAGNNPTPAGDLALIFAYMRMLDPGSVVRESEFRLAASAGSLPEKIQAQYDRVIQGTILTPEIRKDFIDKANSIYNTEQKRFKRLYDDYSDRVNRQGLSVNDSLIDYRTVDSSLINEELNVFDGDLTDIGSGSNAPANIPMVSDVKGYGLLNKGDYYKYMGTDGKIRVTQKQ